MGIVRCIKRRCCIRKGIEGWNLYLNGPCRTCRACRTFWAEGSAGVGWGLKACAFGTGQIWSSTEEAISARGHAGELARWFWRSEKVVGIS